MEVKQIYTLVNSVTSEILGKTDLIKEDLTGVVDLGTEIFNANAVDRYVKSVVNHIGKVIFVNRQYTGSVPSVLMSGWEFGSVLEKLQMELPDATENESWELEDGTSYDPNVFYQPKVTAKFFNSKVTFEVPVSITEKQVKQSFSDATQLNAFLSMIYNAVDKAMTVKMDALIMRTINNMIGETVHVEYPDGTYTATSGVRAINLLKLYNTLKGGTALPKAKALTDIEFLKFSCLQMGIQVERMAKMSTLFNVGGKERFTPRDLLHVVFLSEFAQASSVYLQSSTFHDDLVKLPKYETVPYWQASGKTYQFADTSKINVKTSGGSEVTLDGIIGVMFDRDALGVCNVDRRTTTNYNPKAEFYNNWYKFDASYFNDLNENFVVFFIA